MKEEFLDLSKDDIKEKEVMKILEVTRAEHLESINFKKMKDYYNSQLPDDIKIY